MTLLRYIHQNPLKPHLVDHLSEYAWSSWPEYLGQCKTPFCSTDTVLRRISLNDLTDLINNLMTDNEESGLLDVDTQQRKVSMSDQEVWKFIESQCGAKNVEEFQQLARPEQKVVIFNAPHSSADSTAACVTQILTMMNILPISMLKT